MAILDEAPLLRSLELLKLGGYRFIVPTPTTHGIYLDRHAGALCVRDVLGWSLPFAPDVLELALSRLLRDAGVVAESAEGLRTTIRVASLGEDLFLHSAFPPQEADAVFFGPDTYRFASFLADELQGAPRPDLLIDVGAGSGAGAVAAARLVAPRRLLLTDVTAKAVAFARINLRAAGLAAEHRLGDGLDGVDEPADLIIANPPFIAGEGGRIYRDGGDMHGARLSLDWALAAAPRLTAGGRMLLYTGSAIIEGQDRLRQALEAALDPGLYALSYRELDPDIFADALTQDAYRDVERIAAVGAVITRR